jgi:hypothetical protein
LPIIFGTVTHSWERKLKLMHPSFYSVLCVSDKESVVQKKINTEIIQKGTVRLFRTTDTGDLFKIRDHFTGWNKVLY